MLRHLWSSKNQGMYGERWRPLRRDAQGEKESRHNSSRHKTKRTHIGSHEQPTPRVGLWPKIILFCKVCLVVYLGLARVGFYQNKVSLYFSFGLAKIRNTTKPGTRTTPQIRATKSKTNTITSRSRVTFRLD